MSGYFKLYRELLNKPIWLNSSNEQRVILITLLAMANWKETEWDYYGEKIKLNPGQFIASAPAIKERCNSSEITIMKIRTALERFEKLNFLTVSLTGKSTKSGRLITIVNWRLYQSNEEEDNRQDNRQNNKEITDRQPTDNRHIKEEVKELKEDKEINNNSACAREQTQNDLEVNEKNAYQIWETNIGLLAPVLAERINDLVGEVGLPIFEQAVIKSLERGKRTFAYVQSVARNIANGSSDSDGKPKSNSRSDNAATQYNTSSAELLGTVL